MSAFWHCAECTGMALIQVLYLTVEGLKWNSPNVVIVWSLYQCFLFPCSLAFTNGDLDPTLNGIQQNT